MSFRNERKKASYSTLAVITTPILTVREWCTELVGLSLRRRERKSHRHDRPSRHPRAIHDESDLGQMFFSPSSVVGEPEPRGITGTSN